MANEDTLEEFIEPFDFDEESKNKSTFFQLQFIMEGKTYRYGFEATKKEIVSEWLYGPAEKSETYYFERDTENNFRINLKYFGEGKGLKKNLRKNPI